VRNGIAWRLPGAAGASGDPPRIDQGLLASLIHVQRGTFAERLETDDRLPSSALVYSGLPFRNIAADEGQASSSSRRSQLACDGPWMRRAKQATDLFGARSPLANPRPGKRQACVPHGF